MCVGVVLEYDVLVYFESKGKGNEVLVQDRERVQYSYVRGLKGKGSFEEDRQYFQIVYYKVQREKGKEKKKIIKVSREGLQF